MVADPITLIITTAVLILFFLYLGFGPLPSLNKTMSWQAINQYPSNDWAVAETGTKGKDYTLLRINQGLEAAIGHPDYPIRIGITIPVSSVEDASPTLNALEDAVSARLEQNGEGVEVLVITRLDGQQFKEYVFYVKTTVNPKTLREDLQKEFSSLDIQFYAENDPSWSVFKEYLAKLTP